MIKYIIIFLVLFSSNAFSQKVELSAYRNKSASVINGNSINFASNNLFRKTLSENTIFSITNIVQYQRIRIYITNPSTYTVGWVDDDIIWDNGTTPTQTANSTDRYGFIKIGNILYGTHESNYK